MTQAAVASERDRRLRAQEAILGVVKPGQKPQAAKVIKTAAKTVGLGEERIQGAMWTLINRGVLKLTDDLRLQRADR